jgi:hypothetical protein
MNNRQLSEHIGNKDVLSFNSYSFIELPSPSRHPAGNR